MAYQKNINALGNQKILDYLFNCHQRGNLGHAYLIIGPDNAGKMELLRTFLSRIKTSESDTKLLEPTNDLISIDDIRELRVWLGLSSLGHNPKIAIIDKAQTMSAEAQNAFLKSLEEPAANTYIFLLAGHKRQLLPTIFSRTIAIYFNSAAKKIELTADKLISEINGAQDSSERMRIWLRTGIKKEDMKNWLEQSIPQICKMLLSSSDKIRLVKSLRQALQALNKPKGQNWQLIAENLILSI